MLVFKRGMHSFILGGITLFCLLHPVYSNHQFSWGSTGEPFSFHRLTDLRVSLSAEKDEKLELKRKSLMLNENDWLESIYLTFESKNIDTYLSSSQRDSYSLLKNSYRPRLFSDSVGQSASFERPEHQIWIVPPEYLFLKRSDHTGSFSILFLIRPYTQNRSMNVFQKIGFFEGKKYGLSCLIKNNRIVFQFFNLFWSEKSVGKYLEIGSRDKLSTARFYKVLLRYEDSRARLALFLDSVEQESIYLREGEEESRNRYLIRFHPWDQSPLIVGKNFTGALDEIIFSNKAISEKNNLASYGRTLQTGDRFHQKPGVGISKVYSLPYSDSQIENVSYNIYEPRGSKFSLYLRYSDKIFFPDTTEEKLPYSRLEAGRSISAFSQDNEMMHTMKTRNNIGKGKFFQWKAVFYPSPAGKESPVLEDVSFMYKPNPPPARPKNLEVVSTKNGQVVLRFSRNSELDVLNQGRYHIYYGITADKALGVIRYKKITPSEKVLINDKDRLVTSDYQYQNRIQVAVNNETIYQNLVYSRNKPWLKFEYPTLQKKIAYYFWVTACDNAYQESLEYADHESKPSNYVIARIE